jgi:DNA-binding MarR family transcriptional regulator
MDPLAQTCAGGFFLSNGWRPTGNNTLHLRNYLLNGRYGQTGNEEQVTDSTALKNTFQALKPFTNLRNTMPLQYVNAFLLVALDPGKNVTEYAKRAGISASLMTRHLADLGETNRYHEEGFGLVEQYYNVMDKRERLMRLTAKGKDKVKQIVAAHKR